MSERYFSNHDGEMLFVPYLGEITLKTEFGELFIKPGMIALIPRGVIFKITLASESTEAFGYLCENGGLPFTLPNLGFMGSNGLANPRHFIYPKASNESHSQPVTVICKSQHQLWSSQYPHSPLNVVAWQGNYAPYSYDLSLFNTINTVSFDHPDPSIFTVLTSESEIPGIANLDFVLFPPRWMVAEHTFRPPYFHRNIMSEFMGLIEGKYDAKQEGFFPGGFSIHNSMVAHGPDKQSFEMATANTYQKPEYIANTLAFMFETREPWLISDWAFKHASRQKEYTKCWQGLA
jgi:homogentisate 1,2-dioxygenase